MTRAVLAIAILALCGAGVARAEAAGGASGWSEDYRLGAGDIFTIGLYGRPDLTREQLFVQPDGTLTYLNAQNVSVAGLTIDEMRRKLEGELAKFYKRPRLLINPFELRSKKYYILGKVVDKGVYTMTKPTTILEAVARARGIETGLFEQNTVELADLQRSLLVRDGRRVPVDFEALFFEGDMKQNLLLQPGDYLYFPSANTNEVYVLGEVSQPGIQGFTPKLTALTAISRRQGFTGAAFRERVLIVRGSLQSPEAIVINASKILSGQEPDFPLEPKDIVYVSARPWIFAQEITKAAIDTFLQSAVTTWAGINIDPLITDPLLDPLDSGESETEPTPEPTPDPTPTPVQTVVPLQGGG